MTNQEYSSSLVIAVKIYFAKQIVEWITEKISKCHISSQKFYTKQLNRESKRLKLLQKLYLLYRYKNN